MNKVIKILYKVGNKIVRHTDWYNNQFWGGATKFWNSTQFGLNVVNLGSGAGVHAFCYDGLSVKGVNWALGPQSLVHDFNILKNYFSYIRDGGVIIITVCPFSGLISKYDKVHNFKYYTFLHPATIINFEEDERQRALRCQQNPFKEMTAYCIKKTIKEVINMGKKKLKFQRRDNIEVSAKQMMEGWKKQFGIEDLSMPVSEQHQIEITRRRQTLKELVEFSKERELKPYIILPVMHQSLVKLFPPSFKNKYIDTLVEGLGAPVLDYMNDEIGKQDDNFATALFLNNKGAKVFTRRVLKDLELI